MRAEESGGLTLVVSHNACGQALLATALGLDETSFRKFDFANCGAAELEWPTDDAPASVRWRWRLKEGRKCLPAAEAADMEWRSAEWAEEESPTPREAV